MITVKCSLCGKAWEQDSHTGTQRAYCSIAHKRLHHRLIRDISQTQINIMEAVFEGVVPPFSSARAKMLKHGVLEHSLTSPSGYALTALGIELYNVWYDRGVI